jgi:hypothetical protein
MVAMSSRAIPLVLALTVALPFSMVMAAPAAADEAPPGSPFAFIPAAALETPRQVRADGAVLVEVTAQDAAAWSAVEAAVAEVAEIVTASPDYGVVVAWAQPDAIAALEARSDVRSVVAPAPPSTSSSGSAAAALAGTASSPTALPDGWIDAPSCRFAPVEADAPLASAIARADDGVDGTGVKVGILSDSFATSTKATTTPEQDVALGALPGAGNPCGYETPVTVLADAPGGDDEGRAMAQLVHGIAPGAELLFATGFISAITMADNIRALVDAGADVIVDDVSWYSEPVFQAGPIGDAVQYANDNGVVYFSSAGNGSILDADNNQIASWASSDFTSAPCPAVIAAPSMTCLDFGLDAPDATNRITVQRNDEGNIDLSVWLRWQEPWYGVDAPIAVLALTTDPVDPQVVGAGLCTGGGATVPYACDAATAVMSIGSNPDALPDADEFDLDLVVFTEADLSGLPPMSVDLKFVPSAGQLVALESNTSGTGGGRDVSVGATLTVNNAAKGVFAVGAASVATPDRIEGFSSWGTAIWSWEPVSSEPVGTPAAPLSEPWVRDGVDAVSIDGVITTFFGEDNRFFGTSAAAPNAAAVAALIVQAVPGISVEALSDALRDTADPDIALPPGLDPRQAIGGGLINAPAALAAAGATPNPLAAPVPAALVPADTAVLVASQSTSRIPELVATVSDGIATVSGLPAGLEGWAWVYGYSSASDRGWRPVVDGSMTLSVAGWSAEQHHLGLFRGDELVATAVVSLAKPGAQVIQATGSDPGGAIGTGIGLVAIGALVLGGLVVSRRRVRSV